MNVIAVDDEQLALKDLMRALEKAMPDGASHGFSSSRRALEYAENADVDVAFLDIRMPGMNGLELAKRLKELQPEMHIIFVTSYDEYAIDAFSLHATGYLLKPVNMDELVRELTFAGERMGEAHARDDGRASGGCSRVRVQTFNGFEVFVDEKPLSFKRSKTKELLALLIDRRGASITTREACAVLWEDAPYNASQRSYFRSLVADLRSTLASVHAEDVVVKQRDSLAIDPGAVDCDVYHFLDGDPIAVNSYKGSYLPSYSWAEFSLNRVDSPYE